MEKMAERRKCSSISEEVKKVEHRISITSGEDEGQRIGVDE